MWIQEEVVLFDRIEMNKNKNMGIDDGPNKEFRRCNIELKEVCAVMEPISSGTMIDMKNGQTLTLRIDYNEFMIKYGGLMIGKKKIEVEENLNEY